jgi:ABC-2 type transport system permease protein
MNLKRTAAIARRETLQMIRDRRALFIVFTMPIMLMALFGYGVNLDQNHTPLCVFDREGSQRSQELLKAFGSNRYFDLLYNVHSYDELSANLDAARCTIGVIIPRDFSKRLHEGQTVAIQGLVDASNDNTANLVIGYANEIILGYSRAVQVDYLRREAPIFGRYQVPYREPIAISARTWFNDNLDSRNFVVPGVVAIVMAVIGTFLTSLTVAREWERGTMEQLIATPATPPEIILGKLMPFLAVGLIDAAMCLLITAFWFQVPFRGSWILLLVASSLFLLTVLLMGMMISVLTRNQFAASQFAVLVTFLPSYLLSGFVFPIEQMPLWLRIVSRAVPARYYVTSLKAIFLKGAGIGVIAPQLAAMMSFALVLGVITIRSFARTLD